MRKFKTSAVLVAMFFGVSVLAAGCGGYEANQNPGKCSKDRKWNPPSQDPETGEWKDGYCEWLPGKK